VLLAVFSGFTVFGQLDSTTWRTLDREIRYERYQDEYTDNEAYVDEPGASWPSGEEVRFEDESGWRNIDRDGNKKLWKDGETSEGYSPKSRENKPSDWVDDEAYQGIEELSESIQDDVKQVAPEAESPPPPDWPEPEDLPEPDNTRVPQWVSILIWVIMGLALGVVLFLLLRNYKRRKKVARPNVLSEETNPGEIPLSELELALRDHKAAGRYREAVRVLFLHLLKRLTERGLITWHINKTNSIYALELHGTPYRQPFREHAAIYELVWYGERVPSETEYAGIETAIKQTIDKLS
jgi:hypothetical protein